MGADGGLANSLEAHRKYLLHTLVAALAQGEGFDAAGDPGERRLYLIKSGR